MSLEKAIPRGLIKEKLRNLREHMPEEEDIIYKFGEYLAERLGEDSSKIYPVGFNLTAELALQDLTKGVDGYTGKPIKNSLTGYPQMFYIILGTRMPQIADAVCPAEFAKEVMEIREEIKAKIREEGGK